MSTWRKPVTDRQDGNTRMRAVDMIRITENIDYLYTQLPLKGYTVSGSTISKTEWTKNDIITKAFWEELLTCIGNICAALSFTPTHVLSNAMAFDNINNVEKVIYSAYILMTDPESMSAIRHFSGELYAGDEANSGGYYGQ